MTLLEILQEVCPRLGLEKPQLVMASQDDQLLQLAGLANEVCEDLVLRHNWQALTQEITFTSVQGEDQGPIAALAPSYKKIIDDTLWDRTRRLPIFGPKSPQMWQQLKAMPMSGPYYQFRIQQGHLRVLPAMVAGHLIAFEIVSKCLVLDSTTNPLVPTPKTGFTLDTDEFLLDDTLLILGLRWRWKEEKGLPYLESFRLYEAAVAQVFANDIPRPRLSMNEGSPAIQPGIFVPAGNWNVQ